MLITPYLKPANGVGDTPPIPYYVYCLVGMGILLFGALYWAVWRVVVPRVFGFEFLPRKVQLEDGTFYTVVSALRLSRACDTCLWLVYSSTENVFEKRCMGGFRLLSLTTNLTCMIYSLEVGAVLYYVSIQHLCFIGSPLPVSPCDVCSLIPPNVLTLGYTLLQLIGPLLAQN